MFTIRYICFPNGYMGAEKYEKRDGCLEKSQVKALDLMFPDFAWISSKTIRPEV